MATIFGKRNFFWRLGRVYYLNTLWVENFDEITLSLMVKEIEEFLVFAFLAKIQKFKMAAIFGKKNFLKIGQS